MPRDLVVQRETEPAFDLDSLSGSEIIMLLEKAEHREAIRKALIRAEPSTQVVIRR